MYILYCSNSGHSLILVRKVVQMAVLAHSQGDILDLQEAQTRIMAIEARHQMERWLIFRSYFKEYLLCKSCVA